MTVGLNRLELIGNLGRDPEMQFTPNGKQVTNFSLAVSESWSTPDGQRTEHTEWFNCLAWGKLAEVVNEHCKKGQRVYLEGRVRTTAWEDQEGKKHSKTEVVADRVLFLSPAAKAS